MIDTAGFASTIQKYNHRSFLGKTGNNVSLLEADGINPTDSRSLLVLMVCNISSSDDMKREFQRIHADSKAVCRHHKICEWRVHAVVSVEDADLLKQVRRAFRSLPHSVRLFFEDKEPYHKLFFVQEHTEDTEEFDLVLVKDSNQRVEGLPWKTLLDRKGTAVLASPLRRNMIDFMTFRLPEKPARQ